MSKWWKLSIWGGTWEVPLGLAVSALSTSDSAAVQNVANRD